MTTDATIPTPQGLLERILRFAIAHRWLMLALTVALIAVGVYVAFILSGVLGR